MIFDSHCHYNLSPLYENWPQHWQKAQKHGLEKSWVIGTNVETSRRAIEIAQTDDKLWATAGIHPHQYNQIETADLPTTLAQHSSVLSMLLKSEQVVGVGETGLDFYRLESNDKQARKNQVAGFKMQLQLANELDKWLIIHARDKKEGAYWQILEILENEYQSKKPFVLHCISGPKDYVKKALELGAYIGVAGNITYPNAKHLRELVELVPQDRLLTETDAPYLAPQKYRGQTCEPWMIEATAQFLHKKSLK